MALPQRKFKNNFLGVYETNTDHDYAKEVPFRVAINVPGEDDEDNWINCGYFITEQAAARAYNMYAIKHLGKDAVLNDIGKPTVAQNDEFNQFLNQKPHRAQTYKLSVTKAQELIKSYGNFAMHSGELIKKDQKVQVEGVL